MGARVGIPKVNDWKKGFIGKEVGTSSLLRPTEKGPLHHRECTLLSGPGRVKNSLWTPIYGAWRQSPPCKGKQKLKRKRPLSIQNQEPDHPPNTAFIFVFLSDP